MEYLQYFKICYSIENQWSFKPCYKWNTFNTKSQKQIEINKLGFKPCYKWNTFNTIRQYGVILNDDSFKPCYKWNTFNTSLSLSF